MVCYGTPAGSMVRVSGVRCVQPTMTVANIDTTIVFCKLETGQNDVALVYITASVEDRSWGLADLATTEISLEMHLSKTIHRKTELSDRMAWISSLRRSLLLTVGHGVPMELARK